MLNVSQFMKNYSRNIKLSIIFCSTKFSGNNSVGATPDTIPNSEVKSYSADGTARETSVGE